MASASPTLYPKPLPRDLAPVPTRLRTHDIGEQAERLRHWDQTYIQLSPGRFEGCILEGWLGDIQVFRESTNQPLHESGCSRPDSQTFCLPVSMEGTAHFRGVAWQADACTTMGGNVEFDLRTGGALDVVAVSLHSDRLLAAAELHGHDTDALRRSLRRGAAFMPAGRGGDALRMLLLELTTLIETESVLLSLRTARQGIEEAIYEAVLGLLTTGTSMDVTPSTFLPHRMLVHQAIDYVAARPEELVTIPELCTALRVSRRTLQHYFQDVLHLSPLQYLRAYRLNKVRAMLERGDSALLVADAAARWGFWHLSQFAADYRRLFGELPSDTVRRARPSTQGQNS